MNDIRRTLPCPLCSAAHIVPISRNRSKCKSCKTWLQINDAGDSLQDYFVAKNTIYLTKNGYTNVRAVSA